VKPAAATESAPEESTQSIAEKEEGSFVHVIGVIVLLLKVGCCSRMLRRG
jgi:hypothetical protein